MTEEESRPLINEDDHPHIEALTIVTQVETVVIPDDTGEMRCPKCDLRLLWTEDWSQNLDYLKCPLCSHKLLMRKSPIPNTVYIRCRCDELVLYSRLQDTKTSRCDACGGAFRLVLEDPVTVLYVCAYCNMFIKAQENIKFARCSICNRESSLGANHAMSKAMVLLLLGTLSFIAAVVILVLTVHKAHGAEIYAAGACIFILGLQFTVRGFLYWLIPMSRRYTILF